jgi:hypothetical protein
MEQAQHGLMKEIDGAHGYSIEESVYRRVRYDSEYACNELPERPLEDLELIGASDRTMDTTQRVMDRAAREIRAFRHFCTQTEFNLVKFVLLFTVWLRFQLRPNIRVYYNPSAEHSDSGI